uniref:Uncharacterized protein n=1 Tax=Setaria italica TaxID=4555 RepID=K3Y460_SETIT
MHTAFPLASRGSSVMEGSGLQNGVPWMERSSGHREGRENWILLELLKKLHALEVSISKK